MKPILLDTGVWLWRNFDSRKIKPGPVRDLLEDVGSRLFLSLASVWEISIKFGLGKLPLPEPPRTLFSARLARDGIGLLPIELHHAAHVAELPHHHSDPFDRLLVAQAQLEDLTLISADGKLAAYSLDLLLL